MNYRSILITLVFVFGLLACAGGGDGGDDVDAGFQFDVPIESATLFTYLQENGYRAFSSETSVHTSSSAGAHGMVRTYVNPTLDESLRDQNAEHPKGSASVKELYDAEGREVTGWAVMVKTESQSSGGQGWYWYEVTSATDSSNPVADGNGVALCTDCHGVGGADFFLTPYPLR